MTEGRGNDDLTAAYALGALTGDERREFEAYLAEHPELQSEVEDLGYVANLLALSPAEHDPPPELRQRLLQSIGSSGSFFAARSQRRVVLAETFGPGGLAAAAGIAAISGLLVWNLSLQDRNTSLQAREESLENENVSLKGESASFEGTTTSLQYENIYLQDRNKSLRSQKESLESENKTLEDQTESLESENKTLEDQRESLEGENKSLAGQREYLEGENVTLQYEVEEGQAYRLLGLGTAQDLRGRVLTAGDAPAVLVVENLGSPPKGMVYQTWVMRAGVPEPASLFEVRSATATTPISNPLEDAEAVAVTMEPKGGSYAPTGDILLTVPLA